MRISRTGNLYTGKTNYACLLTAIFLSAIGIFFISDFSSDYGYETGQTTCLLFGLLCALTVSKLDYHLFHSLFAFPLLVVISLLYFFGRSQIFPDFFQLTNNNYLNVKSMRINLHDMTWLAVCPIISLIAFKNESPKAMMPFLSGFLLWFFFLFYPTGALFAICIILMVIYLKEPLTAALCFCALLAIIVLSSAIFFHIPQGETEVIHTQITIDRWRNPADYDWNTGYEIGRSVYDIARGGILGMGIGTGPAASALSDDASDTYIFSGIIREVGWFGMIFILLIYFLFFWEAVKIAQNAADKPGFYLAAIINFKFMITLIFNMFISVNILPYSRIAPPFISYRGSGLLTDFILVGIMLNISKQSTAISRRWR